MAPFLPHHDGADAAGAGGVFVRLGSRSPKDAAPFDMAGYERLAGEIAALAPLHPPPTAADETNARLRAFFASSTLRMDNARAASELLCRSERVFVDLLRATAADAALAPTPPAGGVAAEHGHAAREAAPDDIVSTLVIRRWEPRLIPELEFRCWVVDGRLTAIAQYNHYIHIPALSQPRARAAIEEAICACWRDRVLPALRDSRDANHAALARRCVVDFGVLAGRWLGDGWDGGGMMWVPDATPLSAVTAGDLCVVELNPHLPTTGRGLFGAADDEPILEGRVEEVVMRVVAAPHPGMADMLEAMVAEAARENVPL